MICYVGVFSKDGIHQESYTFSHVMIIFLGLPDVRTGRGQTTKLGTDANISCYPIYFTSIFWEFQHNRVTSIIDTSDSNKYIGGTVLSPSITIRNFTINDIGSYRCSTRNSKGTAHSPVMAFMDVPNVNVLC